MQSSDTDIIYSNPHAKVKDFNFDEQVVEVFPDMISRSVPGYNTIIDTIGRLSQQYAQDNTYVYDLGCSLGAATLAMRKAITAKGCKIVGMDTSSPMVERCKRHVAAFKGDTPVDIIEQDILKAQLKPASVIVLNFTLQFIERDQRQLLINKLSDALVPGGILVLSEKINHQNDVCRDLLINLHHDFKRSNGYSELEIAQKRTAIENIMKTDSLEVQLERLKSAGFSHATQWFQCFNFTSMVAIK